MFWSAQVKEPSEPAHNPPVDARPSRLYLRINPAQPQSALEGGSALGIGKASKESSTITGLKTTSATPFEAGQTLTAKGSPSGAKILAASATELTLSAPATETVKGGQLEAFSPCSEPDEACTIPISEKAALFRAADPDATKAIYSEREKHEEGEEGERALRARRRQSDRRRSGGGDENRGQSERADGGEQGPLANLSCLGRRSRRGGAGDGGGNSTFICAKREGSSSSWRSSRERAGR